MFYSKLDAVYDRTPRNDVKIILGDFDAKIGKEDTFISAVGQYSLHQTFNDNGCKAADFALNQNLNISSTHFIHKNLHKSTWISPDGKTCNQIDHVMIEGRHASDTEGVRSHRGADADTDHFLVRVK
jgi:hypothetical protein